jgi:phosphonoacetate hydrolase
LRTDLSVNDRRYGWPDRPLVVVCLDGSSFDYVHAAIDAGVAPFLGSLVAAGQFRTAKAAMPTFTNPNNVSIVTGVPPARHGISGNFFLDRTSGRAVMMNDASFLRTQTIPAAFSRAGARVAVVTAKDKLTRLLGAGLEGLCVSAEAEGQPVYSSALSEHVLRRGVRLMEAERPDIMYLSTSDYVQHAHAPGSADANRFYGAIDRELAALDRTHATLVVTADHGMRAKTDARGIARIVFLQTLLDDRYGAGATTVILPITDPYVAHHGSLGSFATIYLNTVADAVEVAGVIAREPGIELVLPADAACREFELPPDRIGDLAVCADRETVLGTRAEEHDLSLLGGPLRSHGGLAERDVPMIFNRPLAVDGTRVWRNYDAFWLGLNRLNR